MNIYQHKYYWKIILLLLAIGIIGASLFYNQKLAKALEAEEEIKMKVFAEAQRENQRLAKVEEKQRKGGENGVTNYNLVRTILTNNQTIPVIIEKGDDPPGIRNLKIEEITSEADLAYVHKRLAEMKKKVEPSEIKITEGKYQYLYYGESTLLTQLRWYPYVQLGTIGAFLLIAYLAFSSSRRAEQNQVWVGMARETAHQLGTPLSSLMAWNDMLQEEDSSEVREISNEMVNDMQRLNLIADRFSKIGSKPKLEEHNLAGALEKTFNYVKRRAARKIEFSDNLSDFAERQVKFSPPLLDWVVENLLKNALDAMDGTGMISIQLKEKEREFIIDVSDTGYGIAPDKMKAVFKPGFTTKGKRGWGLGLSLSKRIIEEYHNGKIFVAKSIKGKGTTFRIVLPK